MSNVEFAAKKSITSVNLTPCEHEPEAKVSQPNQNGMDSSAGEITMKLYEAFSRGSPSSPQNGPLVGRLNGKLFVNIFEARGLRPCFDPYVVCVFERNEYISKGTWDGKEEKKDAEVEAGRPISIPMRNRQSSHNSALDGEHRGRMPVTNPHWDHETVL
ncbi:hypothetical protein N7451_012805 [Penicillium sp. IBT 35674x]|nr:hypothetical protein N7451_012805 [Penicillium sp. IBT 35674x]